MTRYSKPDPVYTLHGSNIRGTDKAILFVITHIGTRKLTKVEQHWFPLSQITKMYTSSNEPGKDWIIVGKWILDQKKLLEIEDVEKENQGTDQEQGIKGKEYNFFDDSNDDIPF